MRLLETLVVILAMTAIPVLAAVPGQIVVDPQYPEWFQRTDGTAYFMCGPGDPEGFLHQGSQAPDGTRLGGIQDAQIQRLVDQGGNVIFLTAVRSHGGDGNSTQNPFIDSDPDNGLDQDVLDQWDGWFTQMDAAGITIFFVFYDDGTCIWNCSKTDPVPAEEESFIRALVNRFEGYKNLIWVPAEEYSEAFSAQRTSNIAAVIRAADDHDHPIGSTQHTGLSFDHADDPNLDLFGIQCQVPGGASCDENTTPAQVNASMNRAWNNADGRH